MKKGLISFGIISLIIFACSPKEQTPAEETALSGVKFQKLTVAEAKELALQQDKLMMIDFFSPS